MSAAEATHSPPSTADSTTATKRRKVADVDAATTGVAESSEHMSKSVFVGVGGAAPSVPVAAVTASSWPQPHPSHHHSHHHTSDDYGDDYMDVEESEEPSNDENSDDGSGSYAPPAADDSGGGGSLSAAASKTKSGARRARGRPSKASLLASANNASSSSSSSSLPSTTSAIGNDGGKTTTTTNATTSSATTSTLASASVGDIDEEASSTLDGILSCTFEYGCYCGKADPPENPADNVVDSDVVMTEPGQSESESVPGSGTNAMREPPPQSPSTSPTTTGRPRVQVEVCSRIPVPPTMSAQAIPNAIERVDVRCFTCGLFFHQECLARRLDPSPLPGDFGYTFTCSRCVQAQNPSESNPLERFELITKGWTDIIATALFNLKFESIKKGDHARVLFRLKEDIIPFIDSHWREICAGKSRTATWANTVGSTMSTHANMFRNSQREKGIPGYWGLHLYDSPLVVRLHYFNLQRTGAPSNTSAAAAPTATHAGAGRRSGLAKSGAAVSASSPSSLQDSNGSVPPLSDAPSSPTNAPGSASPTRRSRTTKPPLGPDGTPLLPSALADEELFPSMADSTDGLYNPHTSDGAHRTRRPRRQPLSDPSLLSPALPIGPVLYRPTQQPNAVADRVVLTPQHSSPALFIDKSGMYARNAKGYCLGRASYPAVEGAWYWEATIVRVDPPDYGHMMDNSRRPWPSPPSWRLGWATNRADREIPPGSDAFGYCLKSDGTIFHMGKATQYSSKGYSIGDTIGFYIELPKRRFLQRTTATKPPTATASASSSAAQQETTLNTNANVGADTSPPLKSRIVFFKNGEPLGDAFTDIAGTAIQAVEEDIEVGYYPAVSMYYNGAVQVNFGPDFKFAPTPGGPAAIHPSVSPACNFPQEYWTWHKSFFPSDETQSPIQSQSTTTLPTSPSLPPPSLGSISADVDAKPTVAVDNIALVAQTQTEPE